ncbi:MAG: ABC transporter ATP-binding protein [Thermoplasmata archaeon]|nr:ABC transporter ATP-binding protein [Thermoplasmata archaeon]
MTLAPAGRPTSPSIPSTELPVLRVRGVSKTYKSRRGDKVANEDINLSVRPGELLALLGPNGAGKTTLLRQIAGQLLPSSGTIEVAGIDMIRHPLAAKEFISVIPQECEPKLNLTVEEHVRFFALLKGAPSATITEYVAGLLRQTGLDAHQRKLIRELSGGLRRRVLIAVALAGPRTRLLLLDEPTTGVDPEARRSVWQLIDGLRNRRIAILLTTHYIEEAEYLADRVAIVNGGRVVAEGTVDEIRDRLPYRGRLEVRGLDHLTPEARVRLDAVERKYPSTFRAGNTERLRVSDPFSPDVIGELVELNALGIVASLAPVSLEDAYLSLVDGSSTEHA